MAVATSSLKLVAEQTFFETSGAKISIVSANGLRQFGRWRRANAPPIANGLCASATFLTEAGYPVRLIERATSLSKRNGTTAAAELMAHGAITADAYYRALSDRIGLTWCDAGDIAAILPLVSDDSERTTIPGPTVPSVIGILHDGSSVTISAPNPAVVGTLLHLAERRMLAGRLAITTPENLRQAIDRQYGQAALEQAISGLALGDPDMSARSGALFWQGIATGVVALAAYMLFAADSAVAMLSAHLFLSAFFFGCVLLRVAALADFQPRAYRKLTPVSPADLPVYSVIVGLYREAPVVPDLIGALTRLVWPRSKLEILLACEADDRETIEAIEAARLPAHMRIVRVPPSMPRTKPKALNVAMAQARGSFVTVYDAEDRPHPDQLMEAYQRFAREDVRLACLQAPLVTANPGRNNLAALFHLEYAGLFGGLLPFLARQRMPILLGGTSNHFRGLM